MHLRTEPERNGRAPGRRLPAAAAWIAAGLLALALGACSSDDPNTVGGKLVEVELTASLDTLDAGTVLQYRGIPISEADLPVRNHEALYLGRQEGTASSIVVEYALDVDDIATDEIPAEAFTVENIQRVDFRIVMMKAYAIPDSSRTDPLEIAPWTTYYHLYHLDAPVDTLAFPGPEPDWQTLSYANTDHAELNDEVTVTLSLDVAEWVGWLNEGGLHAFLLREGAGSGAGLVGYSSMNNKHGGSTLESTADFESLGPSFNVTLVAQDTTLTIAPIFDCSTFHEIEPAPTDITDGFFLRTSLRSYPALHFDLSGIPRDALINRASLAVANDKERAWGAAESIVVSEFPIESFGSAGDTLALDDLADAVYAIVGQTSLYPKQTEELEFNVTKAVQRIVNGAYEGTRGFILTAGEDFLSSWDVTTLDPDLYLNQFVFYGTGAADPALRPRLKITYSLAGPVGGAE